MAKHTVLICDDSRAIHDSLTDYLSAEGIGVVSAFTGEDALEKLRLERIDVVVLDIMLPGINGYEVCREIRKTSDVHIIMLSARGDDVDRIVGLEMGADDYLSKPVSPREIVIRIQHALKRGNPKPAPKKYELAELTVYPESYQAFVDGEEVALTSKEIGILSFLISNVGTVMTREHILSTLWGYDYSGDTRAVDTLVKRLRHKLMREGVHFAIRTIYGIGYKIEEVK